MKKALVLVHSVICFFVLSSGLYAQRAIPISTYSITGLSSQVSAGNLAAGIEKSLLAKLENAQQAYRRGNKEALLGMLGAFINEVEAQNGKLIPRELAARFVLEANGILQAVQGGFRLGGTDVGTGARFFSSPTQIAPPMGPA